MNKSMNIKVKSNVIKESKKVKREIMQSLNSRLQLKWIAPAALTTVGYTGVIVDLASPSQGTAVNNRIGNNIFVRDVRINWNLLVADTTNLVRLTLVVWFPNDASDSIQLNEVYTDTGSGTRSCLAGINPTKPSRFRLLHDELLSLDTYHPQLSGSIYKKFNNDQKVSFNSSGTTGMSKFFLIAVSDSSAIPDPSFNYEVLVNYTDDF
jgi:hypothetical protein